MVYNHFRRFLILRVILIFLNLLLISWMLVKTEFYVTITFLSVAAILQTGLLIRYVDVTNDRLSRFFESIRHNDFTQVFRSSTEDRSLIALNKEMNAVLDEFRKLRRDREEKELFLQSIVQHVGIGLLVYDQDGTIHWLNTASKRLLRIQALNRIDELQGPATEAMSLLQKARGGDVFLLKFYAEGEVFQLSISVGECLMKETRFRIASIQNIGNELNKKELEAWHMLTRVLAHEIMNSMTPIISLASSASQVLQTEHIDMIPKEEYQDVLEAVKTIERRAQGLTRFVDTYRSLTRIPKPVFKEVALKQLFLDVDVLMKEKMEAAGILFRIEHSAHEIYGTLDQSLIEQVLINLLLNAVDALAEIPNPQITLHYGVDLKSRITIEVEDNGKGILNEILEEIFIPFFTTKRSGSGIGLSLSRQIMALHGGTIHAESELGEKTVFTLKF